MTLLPHAHGGPALRARLRDTPEDFIVEEIQGIEPDGEGEHAWLWVRKRGANTDWVAKALARHAGVTPADVSYAGMKDRHAVTLQAFTVHLPGRPDPDWSALALDGVEVLRHARHRRKLKRGALLGNRFTIALRDAQGDAARALGILEAVKARGVPNYFGEQRFGFGGANVERAQRMFAGQRVDRKMRSLLLSAARSHLFNAVLAERVRRDCWDRALAGEIWSLAGSRSWFGPEAPSPELDERLARHDIHPSGPLWGRGELPSRDDAGMLERETVAPFAELCTGLEQAGLEQERRALRLIPQSLTWAWRDPQTLELQFELPPGTYATTVLREVADWNADVAQLQDVTSTTSTSTL